MQADDRFPYHGRRDNRTYNYFLSPALGNMLLIKRSLGEEEWTNNLPNCHWLAEKVSDKILNEAAAIEYVITHTTVPVPKLIGCFESRGVQYLITEKVQNTVRLWELTKEKWQRVWEEVEGYVAQLQQLRRGKMGGVDGGGRLPTRFERISTLSIAALEFPVLPDDPEKPHPYVLCHGDLNASNILLDADTLKTKCIIDWEYAGFYPADFEEINFENWTAEHDEEHKQREEQRVMRDREKILELAVPELAADAKRRLAMDWDKELAEFQHLVTLKSPKHP